MFPLSVSDFTLADLPKQSRRRLRLVIIVQFVSVPFHRGWNRLEQVEHVLSMLRKLRSNTMHSGGFAALFAVKLCFTDRLHIVLRAVPPPRRRKRRHSRGSISALAGKAELFRK
jgi:hypothetical protein